MTTFHLKPTAIHSTAWQGASGHTYTLARYPDMTAVAEGAAVKPPMPVRRRRRPRTIHPFAA